MATTKKPTPTKKTAKKKETSEVVSDKPKITATEPKEAKGVVDKKKAAPKKIETKAKVAEKKTAMPSVADIQKSIAAMHSAASTRSKTPAPKPRNIPRVSTTSSPTQEIQKTTTSPIAETKREPAPEQIQQPVAQKTVSQPIQAASVAKPVIAPTKSIPSATPVQVAPVATMPVVAPKPIAVAEPPKEPELTTITVQMPVLVRDLAAKLNAKPAELIAKFIKMGVFVSLNQSVQHEAASKIAKEYGFIITEPEELEHVVSDLHGEDTDASLLEQRPPIVTFMGHVDHGKTSLMDAIRKTRVVHSEHGGITQHIGAYEVFLKKGSVTFLDTPGHEAFTAMRARGARCTDVVVVVIAADSGIMPQTIEAIDHAKAASATIVIAINKVDLPTANIDRVKTQLSELGLTPEDWGGKTITIQVSAKTGKGIDDLLEMLLLEAELLELKANPKAPARGTVIEAKLSKGKGPVATLLILNGTLNVSDIIVCGNHMGRVRAMLTDRAQQLKSAGPAKPVEILGLSGVPEAGDSFFVVQNEMKARELITNRQEESRRKSLAGSAHVTLEQLYDHIKAGKINTLKLIVKADMRGSCEALTAMISQIKTGELKLEIIHSGTGDISRGDVMLAAASDAIVIGFHVSIAPDAQEVIKHEQVDVRTYEIIYEAHNAIRKALEGMLEPEVVQNQIGIAEVRQVFKISRIGQIAGCMVKEGKVQRNAICRIFRRGEKIFEGKLTGLKRFKNDAKEVTEGYECGISIDGFDTLQPDDEIRAYVVETKAKTLN